MAPMSQVSIGYPRVPRGSFFARIRAYFISAQSCAYNSLSLFSYVDCCVDISIHSVSTFTYDRSRNEEYLGLCLNATSHERTFRLLYPDAFTRQRIAYALIDRLWNEGHYRLGDLNLWAKWTWNTRPLGNMSAFYMSAEAVNSYMFDLGVKLGDYCFEESDEESRVDFYAWLPEKEEANEDAPTEEIRFKSSPYESHHPWISEAANCSMEMIPDPSSWLIYIPFDTCPFNIGGSLLAQVHGRNGGTGPHIQDPDYFIDCYEVIRELAEDGIIMAGATVRDGGLAVAAAKMCGEHGLEMDINGLMASYNEDDPTRLLFAEIPGVLIQISANDYDYLDSQLLLQDVAYYPVGHPSAERCGLGLCGNTKAVVADILASLLEQASEGED